MNMFWGVAKEFFRPYRGVGSNVYYGTLDSFNESQKSSSPQPNNMSTVYTCAKILSQTVGMMPLNITKDGKEDKKHAQFYSLKHRMSNKQNNQVIISTLEYMRNVYGNAFLDIRNKDNFEIIPIEVVDDWDYKGKDDSIRYHLNWLLESDCENKRRKPRNSEWVDSKGVLHFKGISADGVFGLPPISAIFYHMDINDKATATIRSFYENRAMSPMSIESTLPDSASAGKLMLDQIKDYKAKYAGINKAGETVWLPPNTKMTPLQIHFQDAQLIETMKFSRDEICRMYGIPAYMTASSSDAPPLDLEQQSKSFKQFSILPIMAVYEEELKYKILSKEDVIGGYSVEFDSSMLEAADLTSQANAVAKFIQSGVLSPKGGSDMMKFPSSDDPAAAKHYMQAQLVSIGSNPLEKSGDGNNTEIKPNKKEEKIKKE